MIRELYEVICDRRDRPRDDSYVSSLMAAKDDKILRKISEETTEVLLAAKDLDAESSLNETSASKGIRTTDAALIYEIADLTFHVMVLMAKQKIPPEAIAAELKCRFGISGLAEKANRQRQK